MLDVIEKIGRSIIQHGPHNRRIYLMKLHDHDVPGIISALDSLAYDNKYEKIVAKIPAKNQVVYEEQGYVQEAVIPKYFKNREHVLFMCKYFSSNREQITEEQQINKILSHAKRKGEHLGTKKYDSSLTTHACRFDDAGQMSRVFQAVFKTYPFPITDTDYLVTVMQKKKAQYFCVRDKKRIVAVSAAEMDRYNLGVEMTDFATLPEFRGQGLAGCLLEKMEHSMVGQGMRTAFSISRALSPAMNMLFAGKGYTFGGTLINNTNIAGRIESMNVWFKHL